MPVQDALAAISGSIELISVLSKADKALNNATYKTQIADILTNLYEAKLTILELQNEISDLKSKMIDKGKMVFQKYYYYYYEEGKEKEGPFCANCYDNQNKKIHLITHNNGFWECLSCGKNVDDDLSYARDRQFIEAFKERRNNFDN